MAELGKKISELEETTDLAGLYTIGTDKNTQSKKVSLQFLKEAADYANSQGDYAKEVGDTVAGNVGVNAYPTFSASTQYAAGSVVNYNGKLYRFTSLHPAGAWVGTDAVLTSIKAEADLKLTELESEKANKVLGKNLLNPNDITKGQGYWSYNDNNPIVAPQYSTSGYISVDGDIIINKATPAGTGHRVFDKDKNIIRVFTTQQYTYQEGDAYVRFTIATGELDSAMIEKGTQVTSYEAYTESKDVVDIIEQTNIVIGLTQRAKIVSAIEGAYSGVNYNIFKGHRYVISNTSDIEVADVRTTFDNGTKVDSITILNGNTDWDFIASGDATQVIVYFARANQEITICERPLEGTTILERVEKTENQVSDLGKYLTKDVPYVVYKDEDIETVVQATSNGCIMRRRGYDIPKGSTGAGSMVQFSVRKLHKDVLTEFIVNTNIPAAKFDGTWGAVTQLGSGLIKVSVTPSLNTRRSTDCFLVFYSNETDKDWHLRLSEVRYYPQSAEASEIFAATFNKDEQSLRYDVFKEFDATTEGYGITRFNNIIDAHNATSKQGSVERYGAIVRIMPGAYNFAEYFPISSEESGYIGIVANTGETFESFDIEMPETTKIEWDGHYGLSDSVRLTTEQAMARSPFHINTLFRKSGRPTIIRGFHFVCSNIRYCIHPESAGYGNGHSWKIENCILEWNGNDYADFVGKNLGIGISCGEDGCVDRVRFCGTVNKGIGGHNNGYSLNQTNGVKPFFIAGANLKIKRCDLGNAPIYMTTFAHDNMTPDSLIVEGCSNVSKLSVGFEGSTSGKQEWLCFAINSNIADNQTL